MSSRKFPSGFPIAFEVWGNLPLAIVFTMLQMPLMQCHALAEVDEDEAKA